MTKECPRSCNACEVEEHGLHAHRTALCVDKSREQCLLWGEHECDQNPESVHALCPNLCGVCTLACVDKREDCPQWATGKGGKACELESHLPALCPQSCGVCSNIDVKKPPKYKTEL